MNISLYCFFLGLVGLGLDAAEWEREVATEETRIVIGQETPDNEFENRQGQPIKENGILLGEAPRDPAYPVTKPSNSPGSFLEGGAIRTTKNLTITESAAAENSDEPLLMGENSAYSEAMKALNEDIKGGLSTTASSEKAPTWLIPSTFIIEFLIIFTALSFGLRIAGSSTGTGRILLLSLAAACSGVLVGFALGANPANPFRAAIALVALLALVKPVAELRHWGPSIKIAVVTGVIDFALLWTLATLVDAGIDL